MIDVNAEFDDHRLLAREIWNKGFRTCSGLRDLDGYDSYTRIKAVLYNELVSERLSRRLELDGDERDRFLVVPNGTEEMPIMIHQPRPNDTCRYWDHPIRRVRSRDIRRAFIDFFDWDVMSYVDFRYYRVRIVTFSAHDDLTGREAPVQHEHARVFFTE